MKKQIRRLVIPKTQFSCERCGKHVKNAGLYEFRHQQYVDDRVPDLQRVCRTCCYAESFGSKGINLRKRENQIEEESYLYAEIK
jgi:hypothetical protein